MSYFLDFPNIDLGKTFLLRILHMWYCMFPVASHLEAWAVTAVVPLLMLLNWIIAGLSWYLTGFSYRVTFSSL